MNCLWVIFGGKWMSGRFHYKKNERSMKTAGNLNVEIRFLTVVNERICMVSEIPLKHPWNNGTFMIYATFIIKSSHFYDQKAIYESLQTHFSIQKRTGNAAITRLICQMNNSQNTFFHSRMKWKNGFRINSTRIFQV